MKYVFVIRFSHAYKENAESFPTQISNATMFANESIMQLNSYTVVIFL